MGMSASQARLLSITSRLTNNEFRAQTITNSKLRLAEKSQEASQEYMDALNSQKLMYGVFDENGDRTYTNLTANTLLSYGRLKNQYSLVNTNGQILLSGSDIKNYENSTTMAEFLNKYGIKDAENPQYANTLNTIFGQKYADFFDETNPNSYTNNLDGSELAYLDNINKALSKIDIDTISENDYNDIRRAYLDNLSSAGIVQSDDTGGIFTNFVNILNSIPEYVPEPTMPDLMDYAKDLLSPACWEWSGINTLHSNSSYVLNDDQIYHIEHVLSQYLWTAESGSMVVNVNGVEQTITNDANSNWAVANGGGDGSDPMLVRDVLAKPENASLKQELQEVYYQACLHIKYSTKSSTFDGGDVTQNGGNNPLANSEISKMYKTAIENLLSAVANDLLDARENNPSDSRLTDAGVIKFFDDYDAANVQYATDQVKRDNFKTQFTNWLEKAKSAVANFKEQIASIPSKIIPDQTDEKYQWYVNLWYRMGSTDEKTKGNGSAYKEIDENLINNAEWLEFCFEHGVLTLEQAQFNEEGSATYPGMGQYDWVSTIYTNASDITSQEDEVAIAIAEVKYKNAITEIENEDKKFDQDLKKLDTEHTALQTEYDSVKEVISKNVERSFKAFS